MEKIPSGKYTQSDISQGGWEAWGTLVITEIERLSEGLKEATAALQETRESRIKALGEMELRNSEHINELQDKLTQQTKTNCNEHKAEFKVANTELHDDLIAKLSGLKDDLTPRIAALETLVAAVNKTIAVIKVKQAVIYGGIGLLAGLMPTIIQYAPAVIKFIIGYL